MEAFLHEVTVRSQDVHDAFAAHGRHGNAIHQTVAFVEANFIEFNSRKK
jgi:hypothetical protein